MNEKTRVKEGNKKNQTKKWVGIGAGIVAFIGLLFFIVHTVTADKEVAELDVNKILTNVDYEAELVEGEDKPYLIVTGDKVAQSDTIALAEAIKKSEGKEVSVYTFNKKPATTAEPGFYTDNLKFTTRTGAKDSFKVLEFSTYPTVEAHVEGLKDWQIDASKTKEGKNGELTIKLSVPTSAGKDKMIALTKGLSDMTNHFNDDNYKEMTVNITSGMKHFVYNTKHANVLAEESDYKKDDKK